MTSKQRFEKIEAGMADFSENQRALQQEQRARKRAQRESREAQREFLESLRILADDLIGLTRTVGGYFEAADARMTRTERDLDALIRALTAANKNGKGHLPE